MKKKTFESIKTTVKTLGALASGIGAGLIAEGAIKALVPMNKSKIRKALILLGGMALADIISDAASAKAESEIDSVAGVLERLICREDENETVEEQDEEKDVHTEN